MESITADSTVILGVSLSVHPRLGNDTRSITAGSSADPAMIPGVSLPVYLPTRQ